MVMEELIFSKDARGQLRRLRVYDQRRLIKAIRRHLIDADPREQTRNKFRLRRASEHADYELRVGDLRVFYRVAETKRVYITLIGAKRGNKVVVNGEEFEL